MQTARCNPSEGELREGDLFPSSDRLDLFKNREVVLHILGTMGTRLEEWIIWGESRKQLNLLLKTIEPAAEIMLREIIWASDSARE